MSVLISHSLVLRILMLAMLIAGVLVKPVVAFAGDLHEAEHAVMADDDDAHGDDAPGSVDPSDAKNPWHVLLHFGHCCGQTPALMQLGHIGPPVPTTNVPLPPWLVAFKPAAHPVALRPPITT